MRNAQALREDGELRGIDLDANLRSYMNKVYSTMSVGMLLTFAVAWAVGTNPQLLGMFLDPATQKPNVLGWIIMGAPLVMSFFFGPIRRLASAAGLRLYFYFFASVMGLSLSWIFAAFTGFSIAQAFLVTSIAFAGLSLYGYTTRKDISGWGAFLIMGVVGLIAASILNIFLGSPAISFATSILGVLIFAGLTAYDTQKIKDTYLQDAHSGDDEWLNKAATMGALSLFMDFINMFIRLLMLFGNRK